MIFSLFLCATSLKLKPGGVTGFPNSVSAKKIPESEDDIMADVRGSVPLGYVSDRLEDKVSSAGARL